MQGHTNKSVAQYLYIQAKKKHKPGGNDKASRTFLESSAALGLAKAQYALGHFLAEGIGGEKNEERARKCIEQAAENGMPEAQYSLGRFLAEGIGGEKDGEQARV